MYHLLILLIGSLFPSLIFAQTYPDKYTFVEDRQFVKESDLFGYTFVPSEGKMSTAHYPDPVREKHLARCFRDIGFRIV